MRRVVSTPLLGILAGLVACDVDLTAVTFTCRSNEVLDERGACSAAGVPPVDCVEASDGHGGCRMTFDEACDGLALPGMGCNAICAYRDVEGGAALVPDRDPASPGRVVVPPAVWTAESGVVPLGALPRVEVDLGVGTLEAALEAAMALGPTFDAPVLVLLPEATFDGDVELAAPIVLVGSCAGTTIAGSDPGGAAIRVAPGVRHAGVAFMRVTGPGDGIAAAEGASVTVVGTLVEEVGGVAVRGATGSAVYLEQTSLRRPIGDAVDASGALRVDHSVIADAETGILVRDEGSLVLEGSVVAHSEASALHLVGANATVRASLLLDSGHGAGVRVERSPTSFEASSLTMERAVIERSHDAGIAAVDSAVSIARTTISATEGRNDGIAFSTDCGGHGLRIVGGEGLRSSISSSAIDDSRGAGVLVASGSLDVTRVVVRDTHREGCSGAFGDAIAAYGGSLGVAASRVETSARAGVATFGSTAFVASSIFGCVPIGVSFDPAMPGQDDVVAGSTTLSSSLCGCGDVWDRCTPGAEGLAPWWRTYAGDHDFGLARRGTRK